MTTYNLECRYPCKRTGENWSYICANIFLTNYLIKVIVPLCRSGNRLSIWQMCCVLPTKARMWPIKPGPGECVPKNGNSRKNYNKTWELSVPNFLPWLSFEISSHWACANWLHFLLSENISAGTNQHNTIVVNL